MANLITNKDGQLMLLTAFLIIVGVVFYTTILNSMVFSANMPSTGLEVSKQDIREFRQTTESEIRALALTFNMTNETEVVYFENNITSYVESIKKLYSARGSSIEVILNNVSTNQTNTTMSVVGYFVEKKPYTFPAGSLIVPMDENQTNLIGAYGFAYKLVDSSGTTPLNSTRIPVWTILQNAINSSVPGFYVTIETNNNASVPLSGTVMDRKYSGGPFLIDANDINNTLRQAILSEAAIKNIKVHNLTESFFYDKSVQMLNPPRIAVYPEGDSYTINVMEPYYQHGEVPYTDISDDDILNGELYNYDILTIPHQELTATKPGSEVITEIVGWVSNGGFIHVECLGTNTLDYAIEQSSAGSAKPWYGFIGVSGHPKQDTSSIPDQYIKLLDNSTKMNVTSWYNNSPPIPYPGMSDPGAPYNVLAQTNNPKGIFGTSPETGYTKVFALFRNKSMVNPDTNILAYAPLDNQMSSYGYYEDYNKDGIKEPQLMYLEAPYDNGLVVYVAGHDLTEREGDAERLIFESFFAASMRRQEYTVIKVQTINVTIKYSDGKAWFEDTFLINI